MFKIKNIVIATIILINIVLVVFFVYYLKSNNWSIEGLLNKEISESNSQSSGYKSIFDDSNEIPVNTQLTASEVISANEKYIVQVFCSSMDGDAQATGVVIGRESNGNLIVLTNYHVIENLKTFPKNPACFIKATINDSNEYYYVEPIFWEDKVSLEDMWLVDFAFLEVRTNPKIENSNVDDAGNKTIAEQSDYFLSLDEFPEICSQNKLKLGEELIVLGYPGISNVDVPGIEFTSTFTATEGIISEKVQSTDYYFNTSAKIDSGNSGGGAFLRNSGCFAGIPTFVVQGEAESMGKILNANNLKRNFLDKLEIYSTPKNIN